MSVHSLCTKDCIYVIRVIEVEAYRQEKQLSEKNHGFVFFAFIVRIVFLYLFIKLDNYHIPVVRVSQTRALMK